MSAAAPSGRNPTSARSLSPTRCGAFWNTFVSVAPASTIWEMTRLAAPELSVSFVDHANGSRVRIFV